MALQSIYSYLSIPNAESPTDVSDTFHDPIFYPYLFSEHIEDVYDTGVAAMIIGQVQPVFFTKDLVKKSRISFAYWLCSNGNLPF